MPLVKQRVITLQQLMRLTILSGALNGLSRPVMTTIAQHGIWEAALSGFQLNVFVLTAIIASLYHIKRDTTRVVASHMDIFVSMICMLAFCIPSAVCNWTVLSLYAGYYAWKFRQRDALYVGCLLAAMMALREPVVMLLLKGCASYVLSLDAMFAQAMAWMGGLETSREGNMIVTEQGRSILILAACSSVSNLSFTMLAWLIVARSVSATWQRHDIWSIITLIITVLLMNWLRLSVLTMSKEAYIFLHSDLGTLLYESILTAVIIIILWRFYGRTLHRGAYYQHHCHRASM